MHDAVKRKMGISRADRVDWELFHMKELRVNIRIPANSHLDGFKLGMSLVGQKGLLYKHWSAVGTPDWSTGSSVRFLCRR